MTESELKQAIKKTAKTLNSRLRRLKNENLPSTADEMIDRAMKHNDPNITPSGYISGGTANMTLEQLKSKYKFIAGIMRNTQTVKQAREMVSRKAAEWNVNKEEAARRIRAGRVFYQVLGAQGYKWDSDQIHQAIQEFDETPTFEELENKLYEKFGADMQDTDDGREYLREWMNENNSIPPGVYAHEELNPITGDSTILYDDESFDENGNIVVNYEPDRFV